jgi:glycosyltransferase involved in cell wall biosynthesis
LGILDREQVLEEMSNLDIGIHVPAPLPRHRDALPTKIFEFMAAGLPYVTANFSILESIVNEYGCGLVVDPTSVQDVTEAIHWLAHHRAEARSMGARGRQAALTNFCWEEEIKKLTCLYRSILEGGTW